MACLVLIHAPDGSSMRVRAILDSASSASYVSERLTQTLHLPRTRQNVRISGVAGLSHGTSLQSTVQFTISPLQSPTEKSEVSTIVVPHVTCDLPVNPITPRLSWTHLSDIPLADPDFGSPGRIDLLLGIDIFVDSLWHGRRNGPPNSPIALETKFGWVLAEPQNHSTQEGPRTDTNLSPEERVVLQHFKDNHCRTVEGRFVVPLQTHHC